MTTSTPEPNIGTLPMIFAHAAYNADPQSVINQYPGFTNGWTVIWANDFNDPNYAFVASNNSECIVAIRGSLIQFDKIGYIDWFKEDFNVFSQDPWTTFVPSSVSSNYNACISAGAGDGLTDLQAMVDPSTNVTLPNFLLGIISDYNQPVTITGHSLGGNLASVFAPWMQWYLNNDPSSKFYGSNTPYPYMQVFTFAAPAAGNVDFADYYNTLFAGNSFRFYNTNDIIPMCPASIGSVANMYGGGPDANDISVTIDGHQITLHDFFDGVRDAVDLDMFKNGYFGYMQTNGNEGSFSFTLPIDPSYTANSIDDWMKQAGNQHAGVNYLAYFLTLPQPLKPAQSA